MRAASGAALIAAALLGVAVPARAQVVTDARLWSTNTLQGRLPDAPRWRWSADVIFRTRDGVDALDVFTTRGVLGFDLTSRTSIGGGYARSMTFLPAGGHAIEHRLFGQHLWSGRAGASAIAFRTRLEHRQIEGNRAAAWRVRVQTRYSHPIVEGSPVFWVITEEVLVHTNATSRYLSGFDHNRLFAGLGRTFPHGIRLEGGYLNQFIRSRVPPDRVNHIVSVTTNVTF